MILVSDAHPGSGPPAVASGDALHAQGPRHCPPTRAVHLVLPNALYYIANSSTELKHSVREVFTPNQFVNVDRLVPYRTITTTSPGATCSSNPSVNSLTFRPIITEQSSSPTAVHLAAGCSSLHTCVQIQIQLKALTPRHPPPSPASLSRTFCA